MNMATWVAAVWGRRIAAPGALGGQCVDLADDYVKSLYGLEPVRLNAIDWYRKGVPGFERIVNTPNNYPAPGDLVVWGKSAGAGTGEFGHIAIVLVADASALITIDQNWNNLKMAYPQRHDYTGVLGWLTRTNAQ